MKERNITVTLKKAIEWYNSGNTSLKEIVLQVCFISGIYRW